MSEERAEPETAGDVYHPSDPGYGRGGQDYLAIGTLESYEKIRDYYGDQKVVPLYIEVEDGLRLERALERERKQQPPKYEEMCRRFLADQADYSEEKLKGAGITQRYSNEKDLMSCVETLAAVIREYGQK